MHATTPEKICLGKTVEGREIYADLYHGASPAPGEGGGTLLIGGVHGNEPATVLLLEEFQTRVAAAGRLRAPTALLAMANPDGCALRTRYNARGVDLNRNCEHNWEPAGLEPPGPEPWSEPESRALRDFIRAWQPAKIVSLHWALAELDADGPQSTALAHAMWNALSQAQRRPYRLRVTAPGPGLPVQRESDAFCPGSFGQWCGYGLTYPNGARPAMITLELPYDPAVESRPEELSEDHLEEVRELWRRDSAAYLRAVEPGVTRMLLAACEFSLA